MSGGKLVIHGQEPLVAATVVTAPTEKVAENSESLTNSSSSVQASESKPRGRRAKPKQ
jgi:hypothetical protein